MQFIMFIKPEGFEAAALVIVLVLRKLLVCVEVFPSSNTFCTDALADGDCDTCHVARVAGAGAWCYLVLMLHALGSTQ